MASWAARRMSLLAFTGIGSGAAIWYSQSNKQHARLGTTNVHLKYPASANYPDLSQHNNCMSDAMTPEVCEIMMLRCFEKKFFKTNSSRPFKYPDQIGSC